MAKVPSAVSIVTTLDERGQPWGFTASSFCSVSLDPPLVLVCLDRTANCYPAFARSPRFALSVLQPGHADIARRFASKIADKFAQVSGRFTQLPSGSWVIRDAIAVLECMMHDHVVAGDHSVLFGLVQDAKFHPTGTPLIYVNRAFRTQS